MFAFRVNELIDPRCCSAGADRDRARCLLPQMLGDVRLAERTAEPFPGQPGFLRRRGNRLCASADGYEIKLPADFKAPDGVSFAFDANSPELANFRRLAHARGLDQQTFSEALGIYAANRIGEQQTLATVLLGSYIAGTFADVASLASMARARFLPSSSGTTSSHCSLLLTSGESALQP